jgi:UDP-glucose 4-epimerase
MIATAVGKQLAIVPLPATRGSPPRRCPDMTRMQELVGYAPRWGLSSGIERTYDWYRRHVFRPG